MIEANPARPVEGIVQLQTAFADTLGMRSSKFSPLFWGGGSA